MSDSGQAALEVVVLGSGSAGNAILVRSGSTCVLVDAGLSGRELAKRLLEAGVPIEKLDAILLTHEHGDHTRGLKVLCKKTKIPVYANRLTFDSMRFEHGIIPPVACCFETGTEFTVGALSVKGFSVPHDAADPVGFMLSAGGASFAILTDLGQSTRSVVHHTRGANGIFIETNYEESLLERDTKRPWPVKQRIASRHGHLSNASAAELVAELITENLTHVILGHLSRDCNNPELARSAIVARLAAAGRTDISVFCAEQDTLSPIFRFCIDA
jgi:phosphoribosyl 1,2-cyclic phosphodiesterase